MHSFVILTCFLHVKFSINYVINYIFYLQKEKHVFPFEVWEKMFLFLTFES